MHSGESDGEGSGDEGGEAGSQDEDAEDGDDESEAESEQGGNLEITDMTFHNEVNLRRTIYLTIMSSLDFEEAGHKLLSIHLNPGG